MQQPNGDLGARMLAALAAAKGPALVIGTDCPVLGSDDLRTAAEMLRISGIGQTKLDRYGDRFLAVLRDAPPARAAGAAR